MTRHESIGVAKPAVGELEQPEKGVKFRLPYGLGPGFDILLGDAELDSLLHIGLARLVGREAISGFGYDHDIDLPSPELPVFVGVMGIGTEPNNGHRQKVSLDISIVTMSGLPENEHRGVLSVSRDAWALDGWTYEGYETAPPLRDLEEVFATN